MTDIILLQLVKDWTKTLDYQSSFDVVCKIANHLGLPPIIDKKSYYSVLSYLDTNHAGVYLEATEFQRKSWNIRE